MLRFRAIALYIALVLLMGGLTGCVQGDNHVDEEKDPHFQRGRDLAGSQDFKGAAAEFEKALETNPRSAAAHFELGWLYDTKLNDYAAAIYHYEQHLRLQPDSPRAALVRERIRGCQQELANAVFPLPDSRNLQRDVDRLNAENTLLRQQLQDLKNQLAASMAAAQNRLVPAQRYAEVASASDVSRRATTVAARSREHIVKAHETISSIAAEYGMKPSAILAANPQTNPRRLRIGQSLNLP